MGGNTEPQANPITEVTLKNYGKFSDRTFRLTPGLNVIRGPNRSGKTWILRAISTVLTNTGYWNDDPERDEIRFVDEEGEIADSFTVEAQFENGLGVRRYRDSSNNKYVLRPPGSDDWDDLTAIGAGFYDPLGEHTGIFPVSLDGRASEVINIRMMTDPQFFLLGESEKKQNRILTRLVGMDVVEAAEQDVNSDIRTVQSDLRDTESRIEDAAHTAEEYAPAEKAVVVAKRAAGLLEEAENLQQRISDGEDVLPTYHQTCSNLSDTRVHTAVLAGALPDAEETLATARDLMQRADTAAASVQNLRSRRREIVKLDRSIDSLAGLEKLDQSISTAAECYQTAQTGSEIYERLDATSRRLEDTRGRERVLGEAVPEMDELLQTAEEFASKSQDAGAVWDQLSETRGQLSRANKQVAATQEELDDMWNTLDVCPLCERAL